jgi:hypothetical protein
MRVSYKPQRGVAAAVVAMLLFIPEGSSTVLEVVSSLLFGSTASKPQPPKWPQIYTVRFAETQGFDHRRFPSVLISQCIQGN